MAEGFKWGYFSGWVCNDEVAGGFEGALFFRVGSAARPDPGAATGEVREERLMFVVDDAWFVSGLVGDKVGGLGVGFDPFGGGEGNGIWAGEVVLTGVAGEGEEDGDGGGGGVLEDGREVFGFEPFEGGLAAKAEERAEEDEVGEVVIILGVGGFSPEGPEDNDGDEVVEPEAGGRVGFEGFECGDGSGDGEPSDSDGNDEGDVVGGEAEPVAGAEAGGFGPDEADEVFHSGPVGEVLFIGGLDILSPAENHGQKERGGEEMGGAEEEFRALAIGEQEKGDEGEVDEGGKFDEEAEGGDCTDGGEFWEGGSVGVVPEKKKEGDGKEKKERLWHEGGGQIEIHWAQEEEDIGPQDGGWRKSAFPERLEKEKGCSPEEEGGEATSSVEGQEWQGGVEGEGGEVEDGKFLNEAGIEVSAPWGDGIETQGAIFEHPCGEGGGLGVSVAFGDGVFKIDCSEKKRKADC